MPKQKKAHTKLTILLKLLAVFIASYLAMTTLVWGFQRFQYFHSVSEGLSSFAEREHDSLVKNVFDTAITKAKLCTMLSEVEKTQCQDEVRIFIATELREEILLDSRVMSDSVHFIKREGDTLYTLNWEGKLHTSQVGDTYTQLVGYYNDSQPPKYRDFEVKLPPSNNNPIRYLLAFSTWCKYFDLYDYNSCQAAVSIPLENDSEGYIVSMLVLTEEDMWWLYSLLTPVILFSFITTDPTMLFTPESWQYGAMSVSLFAFPSVITYLYWRKYQRSSSKKKGLRTSA